MAECSSVCDQIKIIKDSDLSFNVSIVNRTTGDPFDLSGLTEIEALFQTEDPSLSPLSITYTSGSITPVAGVQGKVQIAMTKAQSVLLQAGDTQSFEMLITIGTSRSIVQLVEKLNVVERLFPGSE